MSARVLAKISPREPWGAELDGFHCIACDAPCELTDDEPFCSPACRAQYGWPSDVREAPTAWLAWFHL